MSTFAIIVSGLLVVGLGYSAGYNIGHRRAEEGCAKALAYAIQRGILIVGGPQAPAGTFGVYDDLTPRFVEPTISGDGAQLEVDHRDDSGTSPYL